jgi:hypothetical protein
MSCDLSKLRQLTRREQFTVIDSRVRDIERSQKRIYVELGLLVLYVEESGVWEEGGHRSMEQWIQKSCPYSRGHALGARTNIRILRDAGVPLDQIQDVPQVNIETLRAMSPADMCNPEVIRDAQLLSGAAFLDKMRREYPNAHLERPRIMQFKCATSQRVKVEEAIAKAMELEGLDSREQVLEMWAVDYLQEHEDGTELLERQMLADYREGVSGESGEVREGN